MELIIEPREGNLQNTNVSWRENPFSVRSIFRIWSRVDGDEYLVWFGLNDRVSGHYDTFPI